MNPPPPFHLKFNKQKTKQIMKIEFKDSPAQDIEYVMRAALLSMRSEFSSNQFAVAGRVRGLTDFDIRSGRMSLFLQQNAVQQGRRTWKRPSAVDTLKHNEEAEISWAIELLKGKGYKIQKPVTQWEEL